MAILYRAVKQIMLLWVARVRCAKMSHWALLLIKNKNKFEAQLINESSLNKANCTRKGKI